jgi:hypothetical protein
MKLSSNKTVNTVYTLILVVGCLAFFLPLLSHAYNGTFMRITGDEYCYLAVESQHGFWGMQWYSYQNVSDLYNGERFSLNFMFALLGVFKQNLPSIAPALALILWFIGWVFALWQAGNFWGLKQRYLEIFLIVEILIFFTLYIVTDITQILYWYGGMAQYLVPLILNGFLLGLIFISAQKPSKVWVILLVLLAFFSGGFSETPSILQVIYLTFFWIAVYFVIRKSANARTKKLLLPITLAMTSSAIALLALAISPSTGPRLSTVSNPSFVETILLSLKYGLFFILGSIRSTPVPIFLLLFLSFLMGIAWRSQHSEINLISWKNAFIFMAVMTLSWYLLCAVSMSPSVYAQSAYPGERALLPARFVSVIFFSALGLFLGFKLKLSERYKFNNPFFFLVVMVIIAVLYFYPLRAVPRITSNVPFYQRWSVLWDERDEQIRQLKESGQMEVEVMNIDHPIKDVGELSPDPSYWYNACASQYYGVYSITADLPGWDK